MVDFISIVVGFVSGIVLCFLFAGFYIAGKQNGMKR